MSSSRSPWEIENRHVCRIVHCDWLRPELNLVKSPGNGPEKKARLQTLNIRELTVGKLTCVWHCALCVAELEVTAVECCFLVSGLQLFNVHVQMQLLNVQCSCASTHNYFWEKTELGEMHHLYQCLLCCQNIISQISSN